MNGLRTSILIDVAVVVGLAAVVPLALGRWRRWALAAGLAAVAFALPRGSLAGCVASGSAVIATIAMICEAGRIQIRNEETACA